MKTLKYVLGSAAILYAMGSLVMLVSGLQDSQWGPMFSDCRTDKNHLEQIFLPAYSAGCWLGHK